MTSNQILPPSKRQKTSRLIRSSLRLDVARNPLHIRPAGNLIMADNEERQRIANSMGPFFRRLPDELILKIVSLVHSKADLVSLMHTSRFFYGFVSFDEVWKNLYTGSEFKQWRGTWKKSILGIDEDPEVDCGVVYSDMIFTPYQNSQINYREIFSHVIEEQKRISGERPLNASDVSPQSCLKGRIPRLEESIMTESVFNEKWYNYPFILKDSANSSRWPQWDFEYLKKTYPDEIFRQESVDWPLSLYSQYAQRNQDEKPLYLFDCNSKAMKYIQGAFQPPAYSQNDLLEVFGEDCRPDHTWLTLGPERSGSGFHKDPNSTCAWNAVMQGSKLWIMLPPDMTPPGVQTDSEESEVTSAVGVAEWVLSGFYNDSVRLSDGAVNKDGLTCLIGMTFPGECMYVPAQWWHMVINFETTVALTGNFVPPVRLGRVLNFFKNKPTQISGFHPARFNRLLGQFLANHREGIDPERLALFEKYLKAPLLGNTDEDVGELHECLDLPVYELFVELLKNTHETELEKGLRDMEKPSQQKKSHLWQELTAEKTFSFAFV